MTESDRIKRALTDFEAYARKNLNLRTRAVPARWTEGIMTRLCKGGQDADNSVRFHEHKTSSHEGRRLGFAVQRL